MKNLKQCQYVHKGSGCAHGTLPTRVCFKCKAEGNYCANWKKGKNKLKLLQIKHREAVKIYDITLNRLCQLPLLGKETVKQILWFCTRDLDERDLRLVPLLLKFLSCTLCFT